MASGTPGVGEGRRSRRGGRERVRWALALGTRSWSRYLPIFFGVMGVKVCGLSAKGREGMEGEEEGEGFVGERRMRLPMK